MSPHPNLSIILQTIIPTNVEDGALMASKSLDNLPLLIIYKYLDYFPEIILNR